MSRRRDEIIEIKKKKELEDKKKELEDKKNELEDKKKEVKDKNKKLELAFEGAVSKVETTKKFSNNIDECETDEEKYCVYHNLEEDGFKIGEKDGKYQYKYHIKPTTLDDHVSFIEEFNIEELPKIIPFFGSGIDKVIELSNDGYKIADVTDEIRDIIRDIRDIKGKKIRDIQNEIRVIQNKIRIIQREIHKLHPTSRKGGRKKTNKKKRRTRKKTKRRRRRRKRNTRKK